jgi:hypothetical protein
VNLECNAFFSDLSATVVGVIDPRTLQFWPQNGPRDVRGPAMRRDRVSLELLQTTLQRGIEL